jgi:hypothetical protein
MDIQRLRLVSCGLQVLRETHAVSFGLSPNLRDSLKVYGAVHSVAYTLHLSLEHFVSLVFELFLTFCVDYILTIVFVTTCMFCLREVILMLVYFFASCVL